MAVEIDNAHLSILQFLRKGGCWPISGVARELRLVGATTHRGIDRLMRDGIGNIMASAVGEKLDLPIHVLIGLQGDRTRAARGSANRTKCARW